MTAKNCKHVCYSRMYSKTNILLLLFALTLVGCVSSLYLPTQSDAVAQNTPLEKLKQGRELYLNRCGSCHNLYLPSAYTASQWKPILEKMQKPAKIDDSEKELINQYLETNCRK